LKLTIDGVQLHVARAGNGPPLVLLHGFPLSHSIWKAQMEALMQSVDIIAPDLRGMGDSDAPAGPYLMESIASDVAGILDALDIPRATIVGHSMGGYAALAFFRMFSERVERLALVCTRVDADDADVAEARLRLADRLEREGMEPAIDAYLPRLLAPSAPQDLVHSVSELIRAQKPRGAAAMLRGAALRASSEDLLQDVDVPASIVCGEQDTISPPSLNRTVASRLKGAELCVIERSAHLPMLENPAALSVAIKGFLTGSGSFSA